MPLPAKRLMATRYHLPCVTKLTRAKGCSHGNDKVDLPLSSVAKKKPGRCRPGFTHQRRTTTNAHLTDSERA